MKPHAVASCGLLASYFIDAGRVIKTAPKALFKRYTGQNVQLRRYKTMDHYNEFEES